jgi:hypothetical protein
MVKHLVVLGVVACLLLAGAASGQTVVRFNPADPSVGPYPADSLTVPDPSQLTGERVNLPLPDCTAQPSVCIELNLLNQLDGFNVQPRIGVTFSGAIDTTTLQQGIFFVALNNLTSDETGLQKPGDVVAINQVVYDPAANTAYAKPDAALDQHRQYALIATDALHDASGNPLTADPAFTACLQSTAGDYCQSLAQALSGLNTQLGSNHLVAASIFTTMSATRWLEGARRQLQALPVVVQPPSVQSVFNFAGIGSIAINFDQGSGNFLSAALPLGQPPYSSLFASLGKIAFGSYFSPLLLNSQQTIAPGPTGSDVTVPTPANQIAFHVYVPATPPPPTGYPVVIFGHGFGDSSIGAPTIVAPALANAGLATIAIDAVGHGYGPLSYIVITDTSGNNTTVPLPGRGVDINGDGMIGSTEGCLILSPAAVGLRDCFRQTVVDLMQLVRGIRAGIDLDGDGVPDLDGNRIYYCGESLGAMYGTILSAVEPGVRASVLNVGGGSAVDVMRWSPAFQSILTAYLDSLTPPLLAPGAAFSDGFPFRDQPVQLNAPGSSQIQGLLEYAEWVSNQGDPITFAAHLARSPLSGVPAKSILFQMARNDQTMPNPSTSDLIRTAGMAQSTWMYRHDLAQVAFPGQIPADPHPYLAMFLGLSGGTVSASSLPAILIGLAAQNQVAGFLSSDGVTAPDTNFDFAVRLFEIPASLPEDLGFK